MSEWQPISTAPSNTLAHPILVANKARVTVGWLNDDGWHDLCDHDPFGALMEDQPTHWMPIPEPPA